MIQCFEQFSRCLPPAQKNNQTIGLSTRCYEGDILLQKLFSYQFSFFGKKRFGLAGYRDFSRVTPSFDKHLFLLFSKIALNFNLDHLARNVKLIYCLFFQYNSSKLHN